MGRGSGGVGAVDIRGGGGGGVVQNRESPDFRFPEVGRYAKGRNNGDKKGSKSFQQQRKMFCSKFG